MHVRGKRRSCTIRSARSMVRSPSSGAAQRSWAIAPAGDVATSGPLRMRKRLSALELRIGAGGVRGSKSIPRLLLSVKQHPELQDIYIHKSSICYSMDSCNLEGFGSPAGPRFVCLYRLIYIYQAGRTRLNYVL